MRNTNQTPTTMNTYVITFPLWVDEFGIGDSETYTVTAQSESDAIHTFITNSFYNGPLNLLNVSPK